MRHPTKSRMPHKIAARLYVGRCMVLVGCCVLVFALVMGVSLAAAQTQLGEARLVATEEELSQRNESTRVFLRHYEQPILDEENRPTGEVHEFTRKLVEKADCLHYDAQDYILHPDGPPIWELTVCDFQTALAADIAYEVKTGKAKVSFSRSLTDKWPITYRISERDTIYELGLGIHALAYYDASTGKVRPIEAVQSVKPVAEGNRLRYKDAFSVGDLEYIYNRSTFEQNLIIRNLGAVIDPTTIGMNPQSTYVGIISTLDLPRLALTPVVVDPNDAEQPLASGTTGDQLAVAFKDAKDRRLLTFDRSEAWDASADQSSPNAHRPIHKHIALLDDGTGRLFEGVPYGWLTSAKRQLPITLDYQTRAGTSNGSEAWQSGVTYFISSNYIVPSGKTLVIEGGAVVKLNQSTLIKIESGAKIMAKGSNYNYAVITNAADTVGESIDPPPPGGNGGGIYFYPTTNPVTNASEFDHVKFHNLNVAIRFHSQINLTGYKIRHCIFRDCPACIHLVSADGNPAFDVLNCLMINSGTGVAIDVGFGDPPTVVSLNLRNLTINGFWSGVSFYLWRDSGIFNITAKDNLFSNLNGFAFYNEDTEPGDIDITDNRYFNCARMSSSEIILGSNNQRITSNPYKTSPNGSFYTAKWVNLENYNYYDVSGYGLVDEGETSSSYPSSIRNEIKSRTIFRPFVLSNGTINNSASGDCASYNFRSSELVENYPDRIESGSTYKVDIGFHYDPVHGCVSGTNPTLTKELVLDKGAVLSYAPSAKLTIDKVDDENTGNLIAYGLPDNMILFTSTAATGDFIARPSAGDYDYAVNYTYDVPERKVNFAIVEYSNAGIASFGPCYARPPRLRVQNSIVRNCNTGIYAMNTHINVLNSLMTANTRAVHFGNVETYYGVDANIEGCTFDGNNHALYQALGGVNKSQLLIEDNIFSSQTDTALKVFFGFSGTTSVVRNNLFWNNEEDVTPGFLTLTEEDDKNILGYDLEQPPRSRPDYRPRPLFSHRARAGDAKTVIEPDPVIGKLNPFDGYYLVQGSGDASRRPLRLGDITDISPLYRMSTIGASVQEQAIGEHYIIEVRVSEQIPEYWLWYAFKRLGYYETGGPYQDGIETDPMPVAVRIYTYDYEGIDLSSGGDLGGNAYGGCFDITIANGSIITVWLPGFTLNKDDQAVFWVSEDGSTYYTNMAHNPVSNIYAPIGSVFDMDSYYALRWDTGGQPAQAGYDIGNQMTDSFGNPVGAGTSFAVDAGTVDLLNGGTTKTEISGGENIGDQPYSGWDSIANLRIWADEPTQAKPKLDLGYHYSGDAYTVKVSEGEYEKRAVAIRFPKQGVNEEVAVDYITVAEEVEVHYWLDKGDAAKTVFSGYKDSAERTGAVFETRPIHEGNRNLPGWTGPEMDELFAEEDIRLKLGYAMFRDTPAGIMQDSAITDSHALGNDDIYKGFKVLPGDPSYFDPVEYPPGSGFYYSSGNIRWKVTSLESVTVPFHHRANNYESSHKGEIYVGATLNLSMHDGSDIAYNPGPQGTDMQDFRGRYVASVLRIYRYDLAKNPPWALIAEKVNKVSGFDIDNPVRPTGYPSQNYITTDIRNLSLAVHEDIYGNVSVYAFWLENTTSNRLSPHYKLFGKQISNAHSRSGSGRLEITDANRFLLDDLGSGTAYDRISADLDQWIRNPGGSLPSGYSGLPRLVYGRKDQAKVRTMRITLSSNGEVSGIYADDYLPDGGIQPGTPFMSINRSKYHDPEATHAFAATGTGQTNAQYKLELSGTYYDTDDWSQPEEIESWVSGLVVRPLGSPRLVWGKAPYPIMSNTGEIDSYGETEPGISLNPYHGKYEGPEYWKTSITARNVFVSFSATGGNPGPNWDTDGDGNWQEYDEKLGWIRDQGDLVPTIIFKQVDP